MTASQDGVAAPDAVKVSAPDPVFVTDSVFEAGFAPPGVPLNERLDGETASTGPVAVEANADSGPSL